MQNQNHVKTVKENSDTDEEAQITTKDSSNKLGKKTIHISSKLGKEGR